VYTQLLLVNLKGRDHLKHLDLKNRTTLKIIRKIGCGFVDSIEVSALFYGL
jgi:hypothetical protein